MAPDYTAYQILTFDLYGTLIDCESSIYSTLVAGLGCLPPEQAENEASNQPHRRLILEIFHEIEQDVQRTQPTLLYLQLLAETFRKLAKHLRIRTTREAALEFGASVARWPARKDSVKSLQRLAKYYKLVLLSNADVFLKETSAGPLKGVVFDGCYTSTDARGFKDLPLGNLEDLISCVERDCGVVREEILHLGSLEEGHVSKEILALGADSWLEKMGTEMVSTRERNLVFENARKGEGDHGVRFTTLSEMVKEVEIAFASDQSRAAAQDM